MSFFLHSFEIPERSRQSKNEMGHMKNKCEDPNESNGKENSYNFSIRTEGEVSIGNVLKVISDGPSAHDKPQKY